MDRRQIVLDALNHRKSERAAYAIGLTQQAYDNLTAYTGDPHMADKISGDLIAAVCSGWQDPIPGRFEFYKDEFGVVWNRTGADKDIGVVDEYLIEDIEEYDYELPEPDKDRVRRSIEEMLANKGDKFAIANFGFCMFERSWTLMGMENVLAAMITNPEELEALYDKICEYYLQVVDVTLEYDEVDAIQFGDDWGQQKGLIMGPAHWRHFIKPRIARLYARVREKGKFVFQHSCGDCRDVFQDLIDIGLNCYNTFQPEIYDIQFMKDTYGDKMTFYGAISTQQALPVLSPQKLQEEIVRIMKVLKTDGGLIIAPTHAVPFDVPAKNIMAMAEVFMNQEKFGL